MRTGGIDSSVSPIYMPVADRIRDVTMPDWLADWPLWMEDAGTYFEEHATDFGD